MKHPFHRLMGYMRTGRWRRVRPASLLILTSLVAASSVSAAETWSAARTEHFTVIGDGGEAQVRTVAQDLERFRGAIEVLYPPPAGSEKPLRVVAVRNERGMKRLLPAFWERRHGVHPIGVFFAGGKMDWAIVRADVAHPARAIYHEYVHSLTNRGLGVLPLWLDEGLAQVFGDGRVEADGFLAGDTMTWHLGFLRKAKLMPVSELFAVDRDSPDYRDSDRANLFYAESFLLTQYLLFADGEAYRSKLKTYLEQIEDGASDGEALSRAFGSGETLDGELRRYIELGSFPKIKISAKVGFDAVGVRPLRPAGAATLLGEFLLAAGQPHAANVQVAEALEIEPKLASAHVLRALLLFHDGRTAEGTAALADARRLAPEDPAVNYQFGTLGRGPAADAGVREEALRTAIRLAPAYAPAKHALAQTLLRENRSPAEAVALASDAVKLDPGSVAFLATLLDAETKMGRTFDAERVEQQLRRAANTDSSALAALVRHFEASGMLPEAEHAIRDVQKQHPRSSADMTVLASFLERHGRAEEAEEVLRAALRKEPQSARILNNLAYFNAARGVKLSESLELVEQALKFEPGSASAMDTRAWVLYRLGRFQEADTWASKSLGIADSAVVREHLAEIYERENRLQSALATWRELLTTPDLDDEHRKAIEGRIARIEATATSPR